MSKTESSSLLFKLFAFHSPKRSTIQGDIESQKKKLPFPNEREKRENVWKEIIENVVNLRIEIILRSNLLMNVEDLTR